MPEPLTAAEIARMRRDHVRHPQWGICLRCADNDCRSDPRGEWPCDAAKLLAEIERQADLAAAVERICVALGLRRDAAYDPRTTMLGGLARPGEYTNFNAQAHRDTQRLSGPLDERN